MVKLYHIGDQSDIREFKPRISPSHFDAITAPVVFAISTRLLHNYLLPRDCPRVAYYLQPETTEEDSKLFLVKAKQNLSSLCLRNGMWL